MRSDVYALLTDIGALSVSDRVRMRQDLHTLLETIVHVWSLSSGGQSNSAGMLVIRRRQEAAFFRVFQQTKTLKDAAITKKTDNLIKESTIPILFALASKPKISCET